MDQRKWCGKTADEKVKALYLYRSRNRNCGGKKMKQGICKLCLKESLLCKSHIIPERVYKPMYNEKHKFLKLHPDHPYKFKGSKLKGYYEPLLCRDCEDHIKKYEDYGKDIFFPLNKEKYIITSNGDSYQFDNLDYKKTKLFVLSILWRMSISSLEIFNDVDLGLSEERLRQIILYEKTLNFKDYPVLLVIPTVAGEIMQGWIMEPDVLFKNNIPVYRLLIGGLLFTIATKFDVFKKNVLEQCVLKPKESWLVPLYEHTKIPFIQSWFDANFDELKKMN